MRWLKALFIVAFICALAPACSEKKTPQLNNSPSEPDKPLTAAELQTKLNWIELRYEILQKDNPPQVETTCFRVDVGEAKRLIAENKLEKADERLESARDWLAENEGRYYALHQQALQEGKLKPDPDTLWQQAENFWAKEAESFMAGDKTSAGLYGAAGYQEADLAVYAAIASEITTQQKVDWCLKLADRYDRVGNVVSAKQWKDQAQKLINKRVELLSTQINWCLSGTVPQCDLVTIRASAQDYAKAKKIMVDSWNEIQQLTKSGNLFYLGTFILPDLSARVNAWLQSQEDYYAKLAKAQKPGQFKDFETQQREERARRQALIEKYNRLYCQTAEDLSNFGLNIETTDIKIEGPDLVLRMRLTNLNQEPVFKPRVRLCGGIVSQELDLEYPKFSGNYQTSFSIKSAAYILKSENEQEYELPSYWALVIFETADGKQSRAKATLKP